MFTSKHSGPPAYDAFRLDSRREAETRELLNDHFLPLCGNGLDHYVSDLMMLDHYQERFDWFFEALVPSQQPQQYPVLISGFSLGSEMIIARRCGFREVFGVEVDSFLVDTTRFRLSYLDKFYPALYDGLDLPYEDCFFSLVASGHIIEHTADPFRYLCECLRVLRPGGHLMMEFPTRFNRIEVHTNLPSFEWRPRPVRDRILRALTGRFSPLSAHVKARYLDILNTDLKQI